ncbi:MAG: 6-phosphogluconolactonase [Saprospiraceae bacterium]
MIKNHIFKNNEAVAAAFADFLKKEIAKTEKINIALSGGSTPKVLFDILAKKYADKIDWKKVHFYWGDERCVAPTDEESNYKMTNEKLLQHINIPPGNIHRVLGENDPTEEVDRYGKLIEWNLFLKDGLPIFDLIILGMGSDGHTASIFPHQIELLSAAETCAVAIHPESGQRRITLTGNVINAAKQIHFLVTGASKTSVIKEIFSKKGSYKTYPAAAIEKAEWWMDEQAGAEII